MSTFGEKSIYSLENEDAKHLKNLNERFVRWQDKQITLLTFSINLIFTLSVAAIGLLISNSDKCIFKTKSIYGYSLIHSATFIIFLSILFGIFTLFSRLFDFRTTKDIIKNRTFLFKVQNKIKYENNKELTPSELKSKIIKLNCWLHLLGCATWLFFILQTLTFLTGIFIVIFHI